LIAHAETTPVLIQNSAECRLQALDGVGKMQFTCGAGIACTPPKEQTPLPALLDPGPNGVIEFTDPPTATEACCSPRPTCTVFGYHSYSCKADADGCPIWHPCRFGRSLCAPGPSSCTPECPPRNTYCPTQTIADGCGGNCPTGTKVSGCPHQACFIAGTLIDLLGGDIKRIEDVEVGDKLLDGSLQKVTVKKLLTVDYKGPIFSINGGGYFFTPNHPFLTTDGWKSLDPELSRIEIPTLEISLMKVGDILIKKENLELVLTLDSIETKEKVYNFELDGSHEYIANEYVVHNKMDCPASNCYAPESSFYCGERENPPGSGYASATCPIYTCSVSDPCPGQH